jgi:hypothetical protein
MKERRERRLRAIDTLSHAAADPYKHGHLPNNVEIHVEDLVHEKPPLSFSHNLLSARVFRPLLFGSESDRAEDWEQRRNVLVVEALSHDSLRA